MRAERFDHGKPDELVRPGKIPMANTSETIGDGEEGEVKERRDGEEGEVKAGAGEEEGDDPLNAALSRTVQALGGDLLEVEETGGGGEEQRVIEEKEPIDQHLEKGFGFRVLGRRLEP